MIRAVLVSSLVALICVGCSSPRADEGDRDSRSNSDGGSPDAGAADGGSGDAGVDCTGKTEIAVKAAQTRVKVGLLRYTELSITAKRDGTPILNGEVLLTTTAGSFAAGTTELSAYVNLENGTGEAKLYAPLQPAVATVTGSAEGACVGAPESAIVVEFIKSPPTNLLFSCRSNNIGVLANTATDFALGCDSAAVDELGSDVKTANIRFLVEAGTITKTEDGSGDYPGYVYYPRHGQEPTPMDTSPMPGEPSVQVSNKVRNPRDMLATLVAYTEGDNPQTGDMFSGDPFVDKNDNQLRDDDEPFFSADGSGTYNSAQTSVIWKQVKVVWSGTISTNTSIAKCEVVGGAGSLADLARSGAAAHKSFKYTLLDDYYNALSANDLSDMINWQLTPSGQVDFDVGQLTTTPMARKETGMALDSKGNFPQVTTAATFGINSTYTLKAYNARSPEDMDGDKPYSVSGKIQRTLTVSESGEPDLFISDEVLPACGGILK